MEKTFVLGRRFLKTPDGVKKHVNELLSVWDAGSGFVFQQVHNIMADIPPENIIAMFDTVNSYPH